MPEISDFCTNIGVSTFKIQGWRWKRWKGGKGVRGKVERCIPALLPTLWCVMRLKSVFRVQKKIEFDN